MGVYYSCRNCGNEEEGTDLYRCWGGHNYCQECSIRTEYDILGDSCPICREGHKETYGEIEKRDDDVEEEDDDDDDD